MAWFGLFGLCQTPVWGRLALGGPGEAGNGVLKWVSELPAPREYAKGKFAP